jgi:Na+/melibiose symporter-like transporter
LRGQNARMTDREFPRVLAAEGISNFGSMLSRLVIPWLAVLALQATPSQLAALLVADVAAAALGALFLGGFVDRSGKRAVMLLCDVFRAAVLALLVWGAWRGGLTFPLLVVASAAGGVLTVAFELARSAWMAQRTAATDLPRCNAQLSVAGSVSEAAAFALGGWLYQGLGATLALAVDAGSYLASALCLRGVRETPPVVSARLASSATAAWRQLLADSAEGLRAVGARPVLRALAGVQGLLAFSMALAGTSVMIFVSRDIGMPTGWLGMIFALGALGSIVGASLAPRLGRRFGPGRTMAGGLALYTVGAACVPLIGAAGVVAVALLVMQQIVGDAGHTLHDVHDRTLRQTAVPAALLARADAGIRSAGQLSTLAGALVGGLVGDAFGARTVLWLSVAAGGAAALLAAATLARPAVGVNANPT